MNMNPNEYIIHANALYMQSQILLRVTEMELERVKRELQALKDGDAIEKKGKTATKK